MQLQFPIQVLNWLKFVSQNPASQFYNKFDFTRIAVTGHSRGGKISAYVYGKSTSILCQIQCRKLQLFASSAARQALSFVVGMITAA